MIELYYNKHLITVMFATPAIFQYLPLCLLCIQIRDDQAVLLKHRVLPVTMMYLYIYIENVTGIELASMFFRCRQLYTINFRSCLRWGHIPICSLYMYICLIIVRPICLNILILEMKNTVCCDCITWTIKIVSICKYD